MNRIYWLVCLFVFPIVGFSQRDGNLRKKVFALSDTIKIDTLNIIPNSVFIFYNNNLISTQKYQVDYLKALIIFKNDSINRNDSIKVTYRTFGFQLDKEYKHKDISKIGPDESGRINPFIYNYDKPLTESFSYDGLNKNGSISRGIAFGNNQDVVLNSSLNLQLSGRLNDKVSIMAAITDQNIPLQPDGNTQQLQDFDKVYIQAYSDNHKLTAGDFEISRPKSYFMNFYKKAQGASYTGTFNITEKKNAGSMRVSTSAAISRGKYAKNIIQGIEGNQGPYRLRGNNNEAFIIVIAGTERVFLDGILLERGQQSDYVIDYNTAEIRFNPKRLITKDSRIVAEIEYSDKNYARSLFYLNNEYEKDKFKIRFNFFTEQDSKNQPILQSLTDDQKLLMKNIGDSIQNAIYQNVDSMDFTTSQILYRRIDTLGYHNVYVYSVNPVNAKYRASFSNVGQGNGDYRQIKSTANGRVFEWIAPVNGMRQGSFAPVVQLITPKIQQLYTLGTDYQLSENTSLSIEAGLSNNDVNLFSDKDKGNDIGKAIKLNLKHSIPINNSDEWKINTSMNYEHLDNKFIPVERYRAVEFERDWNLSAVKVSENTMRQTEAIFHIDATNIHQDIIGYNFKTYLKEKEFKGYLNSLNGNYGWKNFRLLFNGSLLQTEALTYKTSYLRQNADLSKKIKFITIGVKEEQERNTFYIPLQKKDSLLQSSFAFNQNTGYITNSDTSVNKYKLDYVRRTDYKPSKQNEFKESTLGESVSFSTDLKLTPEHHFTGSVAYRTLTIRDTLLTVLKPENSLLSRLEYNFYFLKGTFNSSTYYEIGSGQELKKEFTFLEVAAGKGSYGWFDYNNNGIKELNEFEFIDVAAFPDLARYVKVYTPTLQYIKAHYNQFNQTLTINPDKLFTGDSWTQSLIRRFSDQTSLRLDRKTILDNFKNSLNPFQLNIADSNLVSINSYFRNTIYFNRNSPLFGADYNWQNIKNKSLLVNGFESRDQKEHKANARWNINRSFTLNCAYTGGTKNNKSEFFSTRDFSIKSNEIEPKITFQPNVAYRIILSYRILNKQNSLVHGGEKSESQRIGIEGRYNSVTQGTLQLKFNYTNIVYSGLSNNSLSFEMLEGLQTGKNLSWGASLQRNLSTRMQVSLNYDGRKSEVTSTIHTGNVQVRAYF